MTLPPGTGTGADRGDGRRPPSSTRIVIWIVVAGIAIYLIVSGVIGIITKG